MFICLTCMRHTICVVIQMSGKLWDFSTFWKMGLVLNKKWVSIPNPTTDFATVMQSDRVSHVCMRCFFFQWCSDILNLNEHKRTLALSSHYRTMSWSEGAQKSGGTAIQTNLLPARSSELGLCRRCGFDWQDPSPSGSCAGLEGGASISAYARLTEDLLPEAWGPGPAPTAHR